MAKSFLSLLAFIAIALSACGGEDEGSSAPEAQAGSEPCESAEVPEPKTVNLDPPPSKPSAENLRVVFDTTCGKFEVTLDTKGSPRTAASVEYLVENGVYDDTTFHRIAPPFVQGGDPEGTGFGGPGYTVDEPPPDDAAYTQGVMAMAKTAAEPPGRSGSQFFVVAGADAGLAPDFAIAGEVTSGLDVVKTIYSGYLNEGSDTPLAPVNIETATIEKG